MKMHRIIIGALVALMPLAVLMAAPYIQQVSIPPPGQYGIEQLWNVTLNNPDNQYEVWLEGTITEAVKGQVFWAKSKKFQLPPGTRTLRYADIQSIGIDSQSYAPGYKDFAARTGGLPEGDYTFTVKLQPNFDTKSVRFPVRPMGAPRLISPRNGATVPEVYPQFVWTLPTPRPAGGVTYELKLFEVMPGQTPEEALRANPPWFTKSGIVATSLTYPTSAGELAYGIGDFSRRTFDPKKHYVSVRMQQGRVIVDADWNEQVVVITGGFDCVYRSASPQTPDTLPDSGEEDTIPMAKSDMRFDLTHLDEKVRENGQYAWQVSAFAGETKVGESEVWSYLQDRADFEDLMVSPQDSGGFSVERLQGLVFDGQSVWMASYDPAGIVARIDRNASGRNPGAIVPVVAGGRKCLTSRAAFDGHRYVWFTSPYYTTADGSGLLPNNMVVLVDTMRPDTAPVAISVGSGPDAIAFDGDFMWVGNRQSKSVSVVNVATRHVDRVIDLNKLGMVPNCLAFDGRYMWVGGSQSETTGLVIRVAKSGSTPDDVRIECDAPVLDMAFDGSHMWLTGARAERGKIRRWDVASASPALGTVADLPARCYGLVFDGAHMWVLASAGGLDTVPQVKPQPSGPKVKVDLQRSVGVLYKFDAKTGVNRGSSVLDGVLGHGVFDGTHLWLALGGPETDTRGRTVR